MPNNNQLNKKGGKKFSFICYKYSFISSFIASLDLINSKIYTFDQDLSRNISTKYSSCTIPTPNNYTCTYIFIYTYSYAYKYT